MVNSHPALNWLSYYECGKKARDITGFAENLQCPGAVDYG